MSLLAALAFRADVAHTFGDHGGDGGLGFLGEDDDYSSFATTTNLEDRCGDMHCLESRHHQQCRLRHHLVLKVFQLE